MATHISSHKVVFWFSLAVAAALLYGYAPNAHSADPAGNALNVKLEQYLVRPDPSGGELLLEVSEVSPGDQVEYRITYTNTGKQTLRAEAQLPIPSGLEYQRGSAISNHGAGHQVARQDARFGMEPLREKHTDANGRVVWRLVPYAQYRLVRWSGAALPPGASKVFQLRARVAGAIPVSVAERAQ